jgi:hypothetical protein
MVTISKEAFISAIESIREQTYTDFINGERFSLYSVLIFHVQFIVRDHYYKTTSSSFFSKKDDFCEIEVIMLRYEFWEGWGY